MLLVASKALASVLVFFTLGCDTLQSKDSPSGVKFVESNNMVFDFQPSEAVSVVLRENDFQNVLLHEDLVTEKSCNYLFGIFPMGDTDILSQATSELRRKANQINRPLLVLNYTVDHVTTNYFVFMQKTLVIAADAIEFVK